jgi:hypothetical protein
VDRTAEPNVLDKLEIRYPSSGMVRWGLLVGYVLTFLLFALVGAGYLLTLADKASTPTWDRALYVAGAVALAYIGLTLLPRWYRMGSYRIDARALYHHQPHRTYRIPWDSVLGLDIGSDMRMRAKDDRGVALYVATFDIETAGNTYSFPFPTNKRGVELGRLIKKAAKADEPTEVILEHLRQHGRKRSVVRRVLRMGWHLLWLAGAAVGIVVALNRG